MLVKFYQVNEKLLTIILFTLQITSLANARKKPIKTEKQLRAIVRVGQSVNLSVERFVAVGEALADDNPEIRAEMCDACKDARAAGTLIEQLCDTSQTDGGQLRSYADKSCMVRAARALLSSVTRVLLIADTVVVKQLISSKDRVSQKCFAFFSGTYSQNKDCPRRN